MASVEQKEGPTNGTYSETQAGVGSNVINKI